MGKPVGSCDCLNIKHDGEELKLFAMEDCAYTMMIMSSFGSTKKWMIMGHSGPSSTIMGIR